MRQQAGAQRDILAQNQLSQRGVLAWKRMKRIAIDMDEVMADTMGHCLNRYKSDFDITLNPEEVHGRSLWDVIATEHREHVMNYFQQEEFFASISLMPGSQEVVRDLTSQYEVFVATAAMDVPCSFSAKFEWLQEHFPFIPTSHIVFCGDKSIIAADYLIDDNVRQLLKFRGEGIIFSAPHNMREGRFRRADCWEDVRAMFLGSPVQTRNS
jgi:5'(3')-deoxyribonucleotidase